MARWLSEIIFVFRPRLGQAQGPHTQTQDIMLQIISYSLVIRDKCSAANFPGL